MLIDNGSTREEHANIVADDVAVSRSHTVRSPGRTTHTVSLARADEARFLVPRFTQYCLEARLDDLTVFVAVGVQHCRKGAVLQRQQAPHAATRD